MKRYGISLSKNIVKASYANTKASKYDIIAYKVFRKFATREEARLFKRNYTGKPVSIVDLTVGQLVR